MKTIDSIKSLGRKALVVGMVLTGLTIGLSCNQEREVQKQRILTKQEQNNPIRYIKYFEKDSNWGNKKKYRLTLVDSVGNMEIDRDYWNVVGLNYFEKDIKLAKKYGLIILDSESREKIKIDNLHNDSEIRIKVDDNSVIEIQNGKFKYKVEYKNPNY